MIYLSYKINESIKMNRAIGIDLSVRSMELNLRINQLWRKVI